MSRAHVLLAGALSCWVSPALAEGAPPGKVHRTEEELLLFALSLDRTPLAEAFPAYATASGSYLLPLGELCRALGIGIRVDPATFEAKGFIISESRRFRLDFATSRVEVDGRTLALDRSQVEWHQTDLFVAIPLLEQWLPLTISADPLAATLRLEPREELPVQAEWLRARRQDQLRPGPAEAEPFPLITAPYALWDVPFVNQNLDLAYRPDAQPGSRKLGWNGATYLSGDLLYMSSSIFFTSRPGHLTENARGTLFRQDPDGRLLGPLGARNVALGDIFAPSLPLIGGLPRGRGLQVGNFPDAMLSGADRYSLRGTLLPGWTVEVYQNDVLVAFQRFREDGLYEFLDLPLRFGVNEFRLAFYGPEGQRLEERRRLDPSRSQTPAGSFFYQATGSHHDAWPASYQVNTAYGLHRQLDLRLALSQAPALTAVAGEQQRFGMLSLQGYLPGLSGRMDLARDWAGGTATSATLNTGWRASSLTLQQTWLDAFTSTEFNPVHGPIRARTLGRLNLSLFRTAPLPLQVTLDEQRDLLVNGGRVLRTSGQVGTQALGYSVSNTVTWERLHGLPSGQDNQQGNLLVSKTFREVGLRAEAGYAMDGWRTRMRNLSVQGEALHFHPWILQGGYQRNVERGSDQYSLNLNRLEGAATISLKTSYSRGGQAVPGGGAAGRPGPRTPFRPLGRLRPPHGGRRSGLRHGLHGLPRRGPARSRRAGTGGHRPPGQRHPEGARLQPRRRAVPAPYGCRLRAFGEREPRNHRGSLRQIRGAGLPHPAQARQDGSCWTSPWSPPARSPAPPSARAPTVPSPWRACGWNWCAPTVGSAPAASVWGASCSSF